MMTIEPSTSVSRCSDKISQARQLPNLDVSCDNEALWHHDQSLAFLLPPYTATLL